MWLCWQIRRILTSRISCGVTTTTSRASHSQLPYLLPLHAPCLDACSQGKLLASGQRQSIHRDGEQIVVWEYESRKPVYRLSGVTGTVTALKFSDDDRFLAAIGEGNMNGNDFAIWDMQVFLLELDLAGCC